MIATLPRPSSAWRKSMFVKLVDRDGAECAFCGEAERTIWRKGGVSSSDDWECDAEFPWMAPRFTTVHRSSNLEVDHQVPLHLGGFNRIENLWLLCRDCHKVKTSAEQSARLKGLYAAARA